MFIWHKASACERVYLDLVVPFSRALLRYVGHSSTREQPDPDLGASRSRHTAHTLFESFRAQAARSSKQADRALDWLLSIGNDELESTFEMPNRIKEIQELGGLSLETDTRLLSDEVVTGPKQQVDEV